MISGTFQYGLEWGRLSFRYDPAAVAAVKQIPGARWDKVKRVWLLPTSAIPAMRNLLPRAINITYLPEPLVMPPVVFPPNIIERFRPYQLHGAAALATYPGFMLSFDLRTGKTITVLGAAAGLMTTGAIDSLVALCPSSVEGEWVRQPKQWIGLDAVVMEGIKPFTDAEVAELAAKPYLLLVCSYELVGRRYKDILRVVAGRKFAVVGDEIQNAKNRKSGRFEAVKALSRDPGCQRRWATTGTSMRNRPSDMWGIFDFIQPGCMGTFFQFAGRYADAREGEFGWDYSGSSNEGELAARLSMMTYRITRADAGQYLPPSERRTFLCTMSKEATAVYRAQEQANAGAIKRALTAADPSAAGVGVLKKLAAATSGAKMPTAIERIQHHCEERGVKALVFATFHESLKRLWDIIEPDIGDGPLEVPAFCAGGWMLPDKRRKVIEAWKQTPGPAVLLANTLSSGIGIDLSDADVAIYLELCWVPADFIQSEGRIQDIHQGKRKSPPLYEYLLCKGTVDADMGLALINKQNVINAVVGHDAESGGVVSALRQSGAVDSSNLTLDREDPNAVDAALDALQRRLLDVDAGSDATSSVGLDLAAAVDAAFTEDVHDGGDEETREAAYGHD